MDLKTLWVMQEKLDNTILAKLSSEYGQSIKPESLFVPRALSLIVETAELCNSLKGDPRGPKYWSSKPAESRERQLDEFVDILHFWVSCGIALGFTADEVEEAYKKKNKVNFQRQAEGY